MESALRALFEALAAHAYLVVFVGALIDASGVPFPGRFLLAAAGAYAAAGHGHVGVFIGLAALGAVLSDQLWFWAARRGSHWLMDLYCRLTRRPRSCRDETLESLAAHAPLGVILGRFFTVVRAIGWPLLARQGLGWPRFVAFDVLGALVWSAVWVGVGWIVGDQWRDAAGSVGGWMTLAGGVLVTGLGAPLALRAWRRRARQHGAH
jgi:membrane protein DedA with SNARE-associated domain